MSAALLLFALSCGEAQDSGGEALCDRDPPLSYDLFGQAFMDTHCAGCHSSLLPLEDREGATVGVDFDTYAGVVQWASRIEARALGEAPDMPPGGGPAQSDLVLLAEWLSCSVIPDHEALEGAEP